MTLFEELCEKAGIKNWEKDKIHAMAWIVDKLICEDPTMPDDEMDAIALERFQKLYA